MCFFILILICFVFGIVNKLFCFGIYFDVSKEFFGDGGVIMVFGFWNFGFGIGFLWGVEWKLVWGDWSVLLVGCVLFMFELFWFFFFVIFVEMLGLFWVINDWVILSVLVVLMISGFFFFGNLSFVLVWE